MANILDYLDWRGDLTLAERPFNEVDSLILSELCYLDFGQIVPQSFSGAICLRLACERYFALHPNTDMGVLVPDTIPLLLQRAAATRRFCDMQLRGFRSELDAQTEIQFAALCIDCADAGVYVAFRGTDDTLVGWKEDFNMAFMATVPAQNEAVQYLCEAAQAYPAQLLRVGGHSKGGNLALYAAAFCGESVQNQIAAVYNNDGPGLYQGLLESDGHLRIAPKIHTIVPERSVVGMLLEHEAHYLVVRSTQTGLLQHDGFSWQVERDHFEQLPELTESCRRISQSLRTFVYALTPEQREQFVEVLYEILTCTDAETLTELKDGGFKTLSAMLHAARRLDGPTRHALFGMLKLLVKTGAVSAAPTPPDSAKPRRFWDYLTAYLEGRGKSETKRQDAN